jgi:hypothetical protein
LAGDALCDIVSDDRTRELRGSRPSGQEPLRPRVRDTMAAPLGTAPPDKEGKPVQDRILKILVILVLAVAAYWVFGDLVRGIFDSVYSSKLQGDFKTISDALDRYVTDRLDKGRKFQDWDLDKLQGKGLTGVPRDPDGRPYIYDWFFERIVYAGPDGVLQTVVPGKPYTTEGEPDDKVFALKKMDRILFARKEESATHIVQADADGTEPRTLLEVAGEVPYISGLAEKDASLVVMEVKKGGTSQIHTLDTVGEGQQLAAVTDGKTMDVWPSLYSTKSDWVFFQSGASPAGPSKIHKINYRDKNRAVLTTANGDFVQPRTDVKDKWIWFAAKVGSHFALSRFQMSSPGNQPVWLSRPGQDLKAPSASPGGDFVACLVAEQGKTRLEVLDGRSQSVIFSQTDVLASTGITWTPDGEKIGYLSADGRIALTHPTRKVTAQLPVRPSSRSFAWFQF